MRRFLNAGSMVCLLATGMVVTQAARTRQGSSVDLLISRARVVDTRSGAIAPGRVNEYRIDLHGNDYAFLKGHRIMVQVQSTWFPLYDRNPQKFVPNIFLAQASDFQTVSQRVYRSSRYPSRVSVSVAVNKR